MKGDADAALIYGAYTGLVYAAPILGGKMADKYLGYRNAVILGAVLNGHWRICNSWGF